MRWRFLVLLLLMPTIAAAAGPRHVRSQAEGCVATTLSCNTNVGAQLAPGDCEEDGYYDVYGFQGTAGNLVEVTIRSLDDSLPDVYIGIVPPSSDASKTPVVYGNRAATVRYRLATTGTWAIVAGAADINGSGKYRLEIRCSPSTSSQPQNCVTQQTLCRQSVLWDLTPSSCRFNNNQPYAQAEILGQAGDVIRVEGDTVGFQPIVAIYNGRGDLLTQSFTPSFRHAQFDFFVPTTGLYTILITNVDPNEVGEFTLTTTCSTSGCTLPLFTKQPEDLHVRYGQTVTVTAEVNAIGATTYEWSDVTDFPTGIGTTTTPSRTFGPIQSRRTYVVVATNACGTTVSRQFVIDPDPTKRRAVGRR
jgi:hypothetical protein